MSVNDGKSTSTQSEKLKDKAEALFEVIRLESTAWAFQQMAQQIEHAVQNVDDPADVVNIISAFVDINRLRFEAGAKKAGELVHELSEKK